MKTEEEIMNELKKLDEKGRENNNEDTEICKTQPNINEKRRVMNLFEGIIIIERIQALKWVLEILSEEDQSKLIAAKKVKVKYLWDMCIKPGGK